MTVTQSSMTALISFLLARIEEDEASVTRMTRRANGHANSADGGSGLMPLSRISVECRAKRKIIGSTQQLLLLRDLPAERPVREAAWQVLKSMALPYGDHRSYRSEWR